MRINVVANTIIFEGILDEKTSAQELEKNFEKLKIEFSGRTINLDLSKVNRANSSGILIWLKFIKKANYKFKYTNVPVWLINQFNMISGHFIGGGTVESFQAPFFAPKSNSSKNLTMTIGKDVPLIENYKNFTLPNRIIDGEEYEIDFEPSAYFHFIVENYNDFKNFKE